MCHAPRRWLLTLLTVLLFAAGCGGPGSSTQQSDEELDVVVTTNILGDIARDLVGATGAVEVLMQPGQDPHGFALSAQQAQAIRTADLVVANGLDLEESLVDALEAAEEDGVEVVRVGELLEPLPYEDEGHGHGDGEENAEEGHEGEQPTRDEAGGQSLDPHVWLDPVRMAEAPGVIAERLADVDDALPVAEWQERADAVAADILAAHQQVEDVLSEVPGECRKLVTNHDSLRYFAARYDFEVVGTVIPGSSTQAEPSAQDFAQLVDTIQRTGVPAVFVETTESRRLADVLVAELGRDIEVMELHTGSLGDEDSGVTSYEDLLLDTARRIADALGDC